ncbi:hypothetical protein ACIODW_28960 [Streptomyces sp. NPDC087897]|uniref:hypothetical protein n=1 Tax=Streptomyces sp. NPDC087897 TaxID=3365817 RepID=UPI003806BD49
MPAKWEDILAMFHDGTTKLPDRNAVAGPGAKSWITRTVNGKWFISTDAAATAKSWGLDGWHAFSFPGLTKKLMFGFGYDWTNFGNEGGALVEFTGAADPILTSVAAGKNKDGNPALSSDAATILNNMDDWTDGWATQFNTWAQSVGNGDAQLKGETAELFEATLLAVKRALQETYSYYLDGELQRQLTTVSTQLGTTIWTLRNNAWTWYNTMQPMGGSGQSETGPISMAFTHLQTSFLKSVNALVPLSNYDTAKEPGLNWDAIQAEAKASWTAGVVEGLDRKSAQTMTDLATAYTTATMKFSDANAIVKPTFTISLTADEHKEFYGTAGPDGDGGAGTGDTNDFLNKFKEMFGGGAGGTGPDGSGNQVDIPPPVTGPNGSTSGSTIPSGANPPDIKNLLAQHPVTGPDGSTSGTGGGPVALPAGSRIDPRTGAVTDARGKPVTGPDGRPLVVPPGSTLGPGGKIIPPAPSVPKGPTLPNGSSSGGLTHGLRVDSNGNIVVPKGVKVDAQGNLIGADGKPLTNAYGGKLTVPPGSRINADGTITDPQGKQITQNSNSLKTRNPMTVDDLLNNQRRPSTSSGDLFSGSRGGSSDLLGGSKGLSEGLRKSFDGNGVTGREATGGTGGLSSRARAALGLPLVPAAPTQGTLTTQSGSVLGRAGVTGATGGGMPFMPPMGMGGGAPGGGGSGNDRQRNVWLSEDEEVWGTEPEAGTGVIGR